MGVCSVDKISRPEKEDNLKRIYIWMWTIYSLYLLLEIYVIGISAITLASTIIWWPSMFLAIRFACKIYETDGNRIYFK